MPRFLFQMLCLAVFAFSLSLGFAAAVHDRAYAQAAATSAPTIPPVATAAPPDPESDTSGFVDEVGAAWKRGAYLTVCLLIAYGGLLVARKRVKWLASGRRAVITAGAVTALATAILGLSTGNAPTVAWAVNALAAGFALYLRPEPSDNIVHLRPLDQIAIK
jgi:hypothetical protein